MNRRKRLQRAMAIRRLVMDEGSDAGGADAADVVDRVLRDSRSQNRADFPTP